MNSETVVQRLPGALEAEVDGGVVLMNVDRGNCYGLNAVASAIWRRIDRPVSVGNLCLHLRSLFAVDAERCQHEVLAVLQEMQAEGLVTESADAMNATAMPCR